jgi:hypothetical protein
MPFSDEFFTEPRIYKRECGGWLAVSDPSAPIHIGVAGFSATDARERYRLEAAEWQRILNEPLDGRVNVVRNT